MTRAKPILPQHSDFLDEHFGVESQWTLFRKNLKDEKFVDAVRQDTRSGRKLKRFSKMIGLRERSEQPGVAVVGDTGSRYRVKFHPEAKRFSCSCNDWTYKRSVRNRGSRGDCKHIKRMKNTMTTPITKTAVVLGLARIGRGVHKEDKLRDANTKSKIKHKAYQQHFKRPSLLHDMLFKRASVRGRAAENFLEEAKRLNLHPRM